MTEKTIEWNLGFARDEVIAGLENLPGLINEVSNYPNPFESEKISTTIVYILKQDVGITVDIYTPLGHLVRHWTFDAGTAGGTAGANEVSWDGANDAGQKVANGLYLCVIKAAASGAQNRVIRKIGVIH